MRSSCGRSATRRRAAAEPASAAARRPDGPRTGIASAASSKGRTGCRSAALIVALRTLQEHLAGTLGQPDDDQARQQADRAHVTRDVMPGEYGMVVGREQRLDDD